MLRLTQLRHTPQGAVINSKKFLVLGLFIGLLTSCQESLQRGDSLSDAERQFLRERAAAKCIAASDSDYNELNGNSISSMLNYARGTTWKLEHRQGSTLLSTSFLYVWKVAAPNVYILQKDATTDPVTFRFIKLNTTANTDMFDNIQKKICDKTFEGSVNSSSVTPVIKVARAREDAETLTETDTTYYFASNFPAYFGSVERTRVKRTFDNDGKAKETITNEYKIVEPATTTTLESTYNSVNYPNREYCVVEFTPAVLPATLNVYAFPFDLNCTTSDTNGPDADGDAVEDFDPITEL